MSSTLFLVVTWSFCFEEQAILTFLGRDGSKKTAVSLGSSTWHSHEQTTTRHCKWDLRGKTLSWNQVPNEVNHWVLRRKRGSFNFYELKYSISVFIFCPVYCLPLWWQKNPIFFCDLHYVSCRLCGNSVILWGNLPSSSSILWTFKLSNAVSAW